MEHHHGHRFCCNSHVSAPFRPQDETHDDCIKPWHELSDEIKSCDYDVVDVSLGIIDLNNKRAIIMSCIEKYRSKKTKKFIKSFDKYLLKD